MSERNLTEADVGAICDELESRIARRFLIGAGKGVLSIAGRLAMWGLIALCGYGVAHWK